MYSCAEEKEFVKDENRKVIQFEQKTLDEVLQISTFNKAYQKLVKKNAKIGNSALAKSALEEEHDFTIDPEVVKITEAEDGTKSYNMLITRTTTTDTFFENLVIVNDTLNNVDAFIVKYIPDENAIYVPTHSSYAFSGEKEIENIVSSGRFSTVQVGNGCYYTVTTLCYDVSPNYAAEFHVPHSPTSLCSANFIFTSTSLITCEPNETNTVYVGNGPTNPAPPTGSNTGASASGNANTIDLTIVPPCRFNCIEADQEEVLSQCEELQNLFKNDTIGTAGEIPTQQVINYPNLDNNIETLRTYLNLTFEKGFDCKYFRSYDNTPTSNLVIDTYNQIPVSGVPGMSRINWLYTKATYALLHTHNLKTSNSLPSFGDLYTLLKLYNFTIHKSKATLIVVAYNPLFEVDDSEPETVTYAVKIDDIANFSAKIFEKLDCPDCTEEQIQQKIRKIDDKLARYYDVNHGDDAEQFLEKFENFNISLYQANDQLTGWSKLTKPNNIVIPIPCNN